MSLARRRILSFLGLAIGALVPFAAASSESYPSRPLRIVLGLPAGGAPDVIARVVGGKLTERFGKPVVVEARPGASGAIAAEYVKEAPPDGHTLLLAGTTVFVTLPALKPGLAYDPERDFASLTRVASVPQVVAVHPALGVDTVADLVNLAKARPGALNYGSGGKGSSSHLAGEMFDMLAGVKTMHVPYKGTVLALNDLIAGQIHFIMINPVVVLAPAKSGRVRLIATTGAARDSLLPQLPPVAEFLPGYESTIWWGIAVHARTPAGIAKTLHREIATAMQATETRALLAKHGAVTHADTPEQFGAFMKAERERIVRISGRVGLRFD